MGIEGAWKVEMLGPYGWEAISTAFMQGGQYLAGSVNHHSVGTYSESDGKLLIQIQVRQHGESRTIFGKASEIVDLQMEGSIDDDGCIVGRAFPTTSDKLDVRFRLTRLGDLG